MRLDCREFRACVGEAESRLAFRWVPKMCWVYSTFFSQLTTLYETSLKCFSSTAGGLLKRAEAYSLRSCIPGTIDPSTALLIEQCDQLVDNASYSYEHYPHNALRALVWLQHSFLLCRAFESEKFVEETVAFEHKRPKIGPSLVPGGSGRTWSIETSASDMFSAHLPYGTFTLISNSMSASVRN